VGKLTTETREAVFRVAGTRLPDVSAWPAIFSGLTAPEGGEEAHVPTPFAGASRSVAVEPTAG
jgi:hypothetical protein